MCYALKYGIWNVKEPKMDAVNALVGGGYAPLAAMVLAARGKDTPQQAEEILETISGLNKLSREDLLVLLLTKMMGS